VFDIAAWIRQLPVQWGPQTQPMRARRPISGYQIMDSCRSPASCRWQSWHGLILQRRILDPTPGRYERQSLVVEADGALAGRRRARFDGSDFGLVQRASDILHVLGFEYWWRMAAAVRSVTSEIYRVSCRRLNVMVLSAQA